MMPDFRFATTIGGDDCLFSGEDDIGALAESLYQVDDPNLQYFNR